jgi:hypothetical protein
LLPSAFSFIRAVVQVSIERGLAISSFNLTGNLDGLTKNTVRSQINASSPKPASGGKATWSDFF